MEALSLDHIRPLGMLGARCALSAARLEGPEYRPDAIFTADQAGWPGDWEGRAILGQCLICRVTGKTPSYLEEILQALGARFNARGYLGPILPEGEFDEQQLSGHSWLLRGLCEAYEQAGNPHLLAMIRRIVEALFLPAQAAYDRYPLDRRDHVVSGAEAGRVAARSGCWHISTDTGCAFIPLDGVSHAYRLLKDPAIAGLLRAMIGRYLQLDFTALMVQTHATLTGCRGLLRFAMDTGDASLLQEARRIFDLYCREGMTAHYANYNWFGRPQWTEPCAVIDSYMLAMQLYAATGCPDYLETARMIGFNGLFRGQRANGGFGTDSCPGLSGGSAGDLAMSLYEAPWCGGRRRIHADQPASRRGRLSLSIASCRSAAPSTWPCPPGPVRSPNGAPANRKAAVRLYLSPAGFMSLPSPSRCAARAYPAATTAKGSLSSMAT
ncbi:MAG: hypothetical protein ACLSX2_00720 [Christensenellaceae bacterium]